MECKTCGKSFAPKNGTQKYCSETCSMVAEKKRRMHRSRGAYHSICAYCHEPFTSVSPFAQYCSSECHQQFYRFRTIIFKKYQFDQQKSDSELKKLEQLGKDYVLEGE